MTPCLGSNRKPKDCYESQGIADRIKKGRLRDNPTLYLRSYHCRRCGKWHLTSRPDRNEEEAA